MALDFTSFMNWIRWLFTPSTKMILTQEKAGGSEQTAIVKGTLVRKNNMTAIANANVNVTVTPPSGSPTTIVKVTDSAGKFNLSVPLTLVGIYVIKADYLGVANQYKASSGQTTVIALAMAAPTTLTLTPSETTGTVGDIITISATLQA